MSYPFFAMLSRLKYIKRWALMRNTETETLSEHTVQVAFIAHALALIGNKRLGKKYNADRAALLALYHDVTEILTGDMPTPIKYKNDALKTAYKSVEKEAASSFINMLPDDLKADYESLLIPNESDKELMPIIKAADKLSALIKCIEEKKAGNTEFLSAEIANKTQLENLGCKEAEIFVFEFLSMYSCNLDELSAK